LEVQVISIIDDDSSVRAAADNLLTSYGFEVYTFASAKDFLQSACLHGSSCVVADVQMPGMSGLDLLAEIRSRGNHTPFIFITAFPDRSVRIRALKIGAACFLEKPFTSAALIESIEIVLKQKKS
jgi:FixJ family two-component response regulator